MGTDTFINEYKDEHNRRSRVTGRDEATGLVTALRPREGRWVPITDVKRLRSLTTRHLAIPAPGDERDFLEQLADARRIEKVS